MKKTILILLSLAFFLPLPAQEYKGTVGFQSNRLRQQAGNLVLDLGIRINSGTVDKCESMRIIPEIVAGDKSLEMPYIEIQGSHRGRLQDRWEALRSKKEEVHNAPYATIRVNNKRGATMDTLVNYSIAIPYEAWMGNAHLVVHQAIIGCYNEFRMVSFAMDGGVNRDGRSAYAPNFEVALIEPAAEAIKHRSKQGQAFLDFPVNQSVIRSDYRRNPEELAKIDEAFREISTNSDVRVQGLYIHGYASPEGRYSSNDRLARDRSFALRNYMIARFGLRQQMFRVDYTAEDWDGLKAIVEESDIPYKNQIVDIIETTPDPDRREMRLASLAGGAPWREMLRDVFPSLRSVRYQIDYSVRDYSMEEVVGIIGRRDDLLSHRELYLAAQEYGAGTPQYENIIVERIPRNFPDDAAALNNAAALLLQRGETALAKSYLERAGDSPAARNNMGVVYLVTGELDSAEAYFKAAAAAGVEQAVRNLEQVRIKRADNIKQ